MKIAALLFTAVTIVASCGTETTPDKSINSQSQEIASGDTAKWIDNFRDFRTAVYQRNKKKVKQFLDFPLVDSNNHIWYVAYAGADDKVTALSNTVKPFTEKDFDRYYDSVFTQRFIDCVLKLKTEELFKNLDVETPAIKDSNTSYQMFATYNKLERKLILNLLSKSNYKTEEGEDEVAEFSEIYEFDVLNNGKIKFRKMGLAG